MPGRPELLRCGTDGPASALALATSAKGCSKEKDMDDLGYTPTTLGVEDARARTTEPGPGISPCQEDPEHLFLARPPWSL